jgi:hypothetical protein
MPKKPKKTHSRRSIGRKSHRSFLEKVLEAALQEGGQEHNVTVSVANYIYSHLVKQLPGLE